MTDQERLTTGQVLDGKYKIEETLGQGGMGLVYRALHLGLSAPRAIKVMHQKLAENEDFLRRFRNEARLAEELRHPNLVTLYDLSRLPDGSWYIVWEFVEGETLASLLERGASFTPEEVAQLMGQVADGLSAAHRRNIVHRDISPDNLMLTRDAVGKLHIKVLDFGIAKAVDELSVDVQQTATGMFLGKPGYCSPEQISLGPDQTLDARTDVFSLAVVTYQLLTGKRPFSTSSIRTYFYEVTTAPEIELRERYEKDIPAPYRDVVCRALNRDRESRTPTMDRFKEELLEAAKHAVLAAPDESDHETVIGDAAAFAPDEAVDTRARREASPTTSRQTSAKARRGAQDEHRVTVILPEEAGGTPPPQGQTTNAGAASMPVSVGNERMTTRVPPGRPRTPAMGRWLLPLLALAVPLAVAGVWMAWSMFGPQPSPNPTEPPTNSVASPTTATLPESPTTPGPEDTTTPAPDRIAADTPPPPAASTIPNDEPAADTSPAQTPVPATTPAVSSAPTTTTSLRRAAPAPAQLTIGSTPAAEVRLDGLAIGRTPLTTELTPGEHQVDLRTDTGERWTHRFTARPGVTTDLNPRLDVFGSLSVTANVWANVRLNDASPEQTPVFYRRILVGKHTVIVTRDGHRPQRFSVDIKEGETTSLRVTMVPEP